MSKEYAYAYEAGYRDGYIHYELEHCPACKNLADLQEALAENAKLRELAKGYETLAEALCNERECDGCPFDDPERISCKHMRMQTCLRELGIKEDE